MLFKEQDAIKIVSGCPVAKGSVGAMEFSPELVAKIAGAVKDNIEWMVLLVGERSEDGFHVKVTGFRVPKQNRTSGNVNMTEPMDGDGSTVGEDVVGVLHSHHRMGAFFSGTDINELNPYFKTSIVVAQGEKTALGFRYLAEGKVTLPCGSIGRVAFRLAITDSPYWPVSVVREHDKNNNGLGDCDQVSVVESETDVEVVKAKTTPESCGLHVTVKTEKPSVFGDVGGSELLDEIRQMTTGYGHGGNGYTQRSPTLFTGTGNERPSHDWYQRNRQPANYDNEITQHLSRREKRRLKQQGKLSIRRNGIQVMDDPTFGGNCLADGRYRVDDDVVTSEAPHKRAASSRCNTGDQCEMCCDLTTLNDWLYLYIGEESNWRAWLCADCFDFCAEGIVVADEVEDTTLPVIVNQTHVFQPGRVGKYCLFNGSRGICMQEFSHPDHAVNSVVTNNHGQVPTHVFRAGIGHPYCIARLDSGAICGQLVTIQCHLTLVSTSTKQLGEEKGKETRERLHVAGIQSPATSIH